MALAAETTLGSKVFFHESLQEADSVVEWEEAIRIDNEPETLRQPSPEVDSSMSIPLKNCYSSLSHQNDTQASFAEITPPLKRFDRKRNLRNEPHMSDNGTVHINRLDLLLGHYFATDELPSSSDDSDELPLLIRSIEDGIVELNNVLNRLSALIDPCKSMFGTKINNDVRAHIDWVMNIKKEANERILSWKARKVVIEDEMVECINNAIRKSVE